MLFTDLPTQCMSFPGSSDGKEPAYHVGDPGSILGSGRSPGEGNGNPLQYSCLENSMDRGAWWATVHGIADSDTTVANTFTLHTYILFTDLQTQYNIIYLPDNQCHLPIHPFTHPSIHPSVHLSIYPSIYLSIYFAHLLALEFVLL